MTEPADLRDRVVLVTGGASGLGRATVLALAEAGARVVVADVQEEQGREVAAQVDGEFLRVDVSDLDENRLMAEQVVERCGRLDHAFLNAGVTSGCGLGEDFDLARYRRAMGVNLDGVVFGAHAVLPALRAAGGGSILATASLAGLTAVPLDPLYSANKHAVVGLVRSLGPALAAEGIRVNALCPGFAESAMTAPLREGLEQAGFTLIPAETVADAALELFRGGMTGECWFVQAGRPAGPFRFRGIPGPGRDAAAPPPTV